MNAFDRESFSWIFIDDVKKKKKAWAEFMEIHLTSEWLRMNAWELFTIFIKYFLHIFISNVGVIT